MDGDYSNNPDPKVLASADGFVRFWSAYPRHVAKGAAVKAWAKLDPDEEMVQRICHALGDQKKYRQAAEDKNKGLPERHQKFLPDWPHPSTWLNQQRYDDEIPSTSALLVEEKTADMCACGKGVVRCLNMCSRCYTLKAHPDFIDGIKAALANLGWKRQEGETNHQTYLRVMKESGVMQRLEQKMRGPGWMK